MLKKVEELRIPLDITIDQEKEEALIDVSSQTIKLKKETYSDWIKITFRPGLGIKIKAICRFYITQIEPNFEMYLTPLNIDPEKPARPISHPFIYSVYLAKLLGNYITLGEANDTWALNEGVLSEDAFLELTYSNHKEWEDMLFNAMDKTKKGVVASWFETTDSIQHMFYRYLDKDHPALKTDQAKKSKLVMEDLYQKMDDLVGRTLDKLEKNAVLIIMSDHGIKSFRRCVNLNSWLYLNGYLSLKNEKKESGEWFENVDWENTKAYGLGLGGIYINQKGREEKGIVEPGEQTNELKKELISKLQDLKDEEKKQTAVTKVFDRDELPKGPYKENCPDLIMGYNEGYRVSWDSVTGKVNTILFEDNTKAWSGDHCIDPRQVPGVFFSNRKINTKTPAIIDIAPTVLDMFGAEIPAFMDGKPLTGREDNSQKSIEKGNKK
jgi:predicted AlkP superfamily phosphohydrolase/phosphomutase